MSQSIFFHFRKWGLSLFVLTFIFLCICANKRVARRYRPGYPYDFGSGKRIFVDDYGSTSLRESECPNSTDENPNIVFRNESYNPYFSLSCLSLYPITFDFDGNKAFPFSVKKFVANANPFNKTSKPCFIINLFNYVNFGGGTSPVGNYTCKSLTQNGKSSSFFIHLQEQWSRYSYSPASSFSVRSDQKVYINKDNVKSFTIPCVANRETVVNVTLKKTQEGTGNEIDVNHFEGFKSTFDPFRGFIVDYMKPPPLVPTTIGTTQAPKLPSNSSTQIPTTTSPPIPKRTDVDGKYVCVDLGPLNMDSIEVVHEDYLVFPNRTNLTFPPSGQLSFECYSGTPISIKKLDDKLKLEEVKETPRNDLSQAGFKYGIKTTFKTNDASAKGKIACVETATGKNLFVWSFDNSLRCTCKWNYTGGIEGLDAYNRRYGYYYENEEPEFGETPETPSRQRFQSDWAYFESPYLYSELTCSSPKAAQVDFSIMHCANDEECKSYKETCEKDPIYCEGLKDRPYYYGPETEAPTNGSVTHKTMYRAGILECNADNFISNIDISTDWDLNMHFNEDWKNKQGDEVLHIRASEKLVYIGDRMLFQCTGSNYPIVHPVVWAFEFSDKEGGYNVSEYDFDHTMTYYSDRLVMQAFMFGAFRSTYLTIPTRKVSKLWCYAPKWSLTASGDLDWFKTSINLQVEDGEIAPNPLPCPKSKSAPQIVMYRNSSLSKQRVRLPHLIDGKEAFVFDPVDSVSLYCMAKYPIIWMKDGINITEDRSTRANCRRDSGEIVMRYLYKSTLSFPVSSLNATGNYSCRSITPNQARTSSTYIYARGHQNRTTFVNEGHHYIIRHKWDNSSESWNDKKWATLPCKLNTPKETPYLFIDRTDEDREETERVFFNNEYLRYSSKVGFSVDVTSRKVIREDKTVFFCSDHKDGSFIGVMITLELIYDAPPVPHQNETLTTTPTPVENKTTTGTPQIPINQPLKTQNDSGGNTGFIVTTVLLCGFCAASLGIIYKLYLKIRGYETSKSLEMNWRRPQDGNFSNGGNGHVPIDTVTLTEDADESLSSAQTQIIPNILGAEMPSTFGDGFDTVISRDSNVTPTVPSSVSNVAEENEKIVFPSLSEIDFGLKKM